MHFKIIQAISISFNDPQHIVNLPIFRLQQPNP